MLKLENVTDASFTSSQKGLLTLFVVGLIKIVIGIEFIGTKITIPGLPEINLQHLDRIVYLYWVLVFYSLYRYLLTNLEHLRKLRIESLAWGLEHYRIGLRFVEKFILSEDEYFTTKVISERNDDVKIVIYIYDEPDSVSGSFDINFGNGERIKNVEFSSHPGYGRLIRAIKDEFLKNDIWGLSYYYEEVPNNDKIEYYHGYKISTPIRFQLYYISIFSMIKMVFRDIRVVDFYLPVIANLALFIFYIYT